mgnify:CR=1 FL=1
MSGYLSVFCNSGTATGVTAASAIAAIGEDFQKTFPVCEEITWRKCRNTNLWQRLTRALLRVFSPLM